MTTLRLVAVSSGLSVPSSTRMLVDAAVESASDYARSLGHEVEVEVIELRDLAMDVAQVMVTGMPQNRVEAALDALEAADAVIAVTPVFAGSYAGVFKSFMDLVGTQRLDGTPVFLGATGGSVRHSLAVDHALRPLFATLHAQVTATGVFAATEDFGSSWKGQNASGLAPRIARASKELINLALARLGAAPAQDDDPVGTPGPQAVAKLLKSDGTAGRLRPDLEDFLPMADLLK
ncbi:CE1759 family FMN reductase [Schaalia canis]|uniref:CE1759 family FMN reductase n=1 Tax=Schaalia canis TaxID=100469 RepID=UPI00196A5389|nr:CE1759 family FMN reductase [Schaalia canis]